MIEYFDSHYFKNKWENFPIIVDYCNYIKVKYPFFKLYKP